MNLSNNDMKSSKLGNLKIFIEKFIKIWKNIQCLQFISILFIFIILDISKNVF